MTPGNLAVVMLFCLFGCASGHALADNWRPAWQVVLYGLLLSAGARVTALILLGWHLGGPVDEAVAFSLLALVIAPITAVAFRLTLARKMPMQYPWLYERQGLLGWREKRTQLTPHE